MVRPTKPVLALAPLALLTCASHAAATSAFVSPTTDAHHARAQSCPIGRPSRSDAAGAAAATAAAAAATKRVRSPSRRSRLAMLPETTAPLMLASISTAATAVPDAEIGRKIVALANDVASLLLTSTAPWHAYAVSAILMGGLLNVALNAKESEAPYEPGTSTYDPKAAESFYRNRPWLVAGRVLKLAYLTSTFNAGLLFDWLVLGKLMRDEEYRALRRAEPRRAKEALELCEKLGPTFIKLGQALSIRTDIVPEAYAMELRKLQDAVPPFPSDVAYDVLRRELGVADLSEVFESLSETPVASASIGQVYRGTLRDSSGGKDVAVKVQRPGILGEIALDLHVLRLLTPIQTTLQNLANGIKTTQEDIDTAILLVDEWGRGFVAETDYRLEAINTVDFEAAMRSRGLDAVCAPSVLDEYTRDKVLVTQWVEGTRLDRDASPDVPRLCGVAINAYLTMLLDTGVLHCDPHPGNLLRTTDGKLCILDWGMTLRVPNDLQYALLEFIAHINVEDYDAIPQDFINLGFSPEGVSAQRLKDSGITEGLSFAFRQLSAGGGPKKIQERVKAEFQERYGSDLSDEELRSAARAEMMQRMEEQLAKEGVDVKGVTNVMEEMSRRNRELFALPPYILYVARAFSTLEGIGLSIDENYSIVQECYPYLSRRLFTDRSPRAKRALRAMLGLAEEEEETMSVGGTLAASGRIEQNADSQFRVASSVDVIKSSTTASLSRASADAPFDPPKNGYALSPGKLIEMSEGFASYTAATADVDRDGAGRAAAALEFAKLLLDPEGSTLQDILVDEAARFGDAATRSALRAALVDNLAARTAASALRRPKEMLDRTSPSVRKMVPDRVRHMLIDRPATFPDLVEKLVSPNEEDERVLAVARELRDALGPRIASAASSTVTGTTNTAAAATAATTATGAATTKSTPTRPASAASAAASILSDAETRNAIAEQLPGVAALGRRVGAGLLRRAAYRADRSGKLLPERTRKALVNVNRALADAIEPKADRDEKR